MCVCVCGCVCARACGLVQLQGLFEHKAKVPSLLNPATHTFKMASWADNASVGEGDMGTNVVWMYPQVRASEMALAGRRVVADWPCCTQGGRVHGKDAETSNRCVCAAEHSLPAALRSCASWDGVVGVGMGGRQTEKVPLRLCCQFRLSIRHAVHARALLSRLTDAAPPPCQLWQPKGDHKHESAFKGRRALL